MNWKTKAWAFRLLSASPNGTILHFLLQRYITKSWPRPLKDTIALKNVAEAYISDIEMHLAVPLDEIVILEIGAGRDLAVPLALRLLGVKQVISVDIDRLVKLDLVNHTLYQLCRQLDIKYNEINTFDELYDFGIDYRAPFSFKENEIFSNVDVFVSNETLEHIPPDDIRSIFTKSFRSMKTPSLCIHSIDYSDHYARGEKVSRYNFLKFTDEEWSVYNTKFQYVNRMRHSEYLEIFENTGFEVIKSETFSEEIPSDIRNKLAPRFLEYSQEDLRIQRSRILAHKI